MPEIIEKVEQVLVVPAGAILPLLTIPFCRPNMDDVIRVILDNAEWMKRPQAEVTPAFKQIIPYVVIRHEENYLVYKRLPKQGEPRLHDKLSLGVGGHINPETLTKGFANIVEASMYRELDEEVSVETKSITPAGVLYDDFSDVGRVHVGLVFVLEASSPVFKVNEPDKIEAWWATFPQVLEGYPLMEGWSKFLVQHGVVKCLHDFPPERA